jgi:hypothetical protein
MASAERVLANEFKAQQKEQWSHVEVSGTYTVEGWVQPTDFGDN